MSNPLSPSIGRFDDVWDQLARRGCCDRRGGAEYERILAAWVREGCPWGIVCFIVVHASLGPPPLQTPTDDPS